MFGGAVGAALGVLLAPRLGESRRAALTRLRLSLRPGRGSLSAFAGTPCSAGRPDLRPGGAGAGRGADGSGRTEEGRKTKDDSRRRARGPASTAGFKELEIVAYIGEFKIVGVAHFGVGQRAELAARLRLHPRFRRRPPHALAGAHLQQGHQELLDTAPFILLNMDKVDFIYARDEDEGRPARRA